MSERTVTLSRKYKIKRWMLFSSNLVGIIIIITLTVLGVHGIGPRKERGRVVLITLSVVSISVNLLGMAGALLEHVYLLYTYSTLSVIIGLANIVNVVEGNNVGWFSILQHLFIAYQAYSFAKEIKRLRRAQNNLTEVYDDCQQGILSKEQELSSKINVQTQTDDQAPGPQITIKQN